MSQMRYAESHGSPPPAPAASDAQPHRRATDRIREAARTGQYWVLHPEDDGTWSLRHFDDATGLLGPALHVSGPLGSDPNAALDWAGRLTGITGWQGGGSAPGSYIEEAHALVRELAYIPRPGRHIVARIESDPSLPGVELLVIRERWPASGQESDPLYFCEASGFDDRADMLQQVSAWFGLNPTGWTTVVDGAEYHHQP
jgi:hypothetical protein